MTERKGGRGGWNTEGSSSDEEVSGRDKLTGSARKASKSNAPGIPRTIDSGNRPSVGGSISHGPW